MPLNFEARTPFGNAFELQAIPSYDGRYGDRDRSDEPAPHIKRQRMVEQGSSPNSDFELCASIQRPTACYADHNDAVQIIRRSTDT